QRSLAEEMRSQGVVGIALTATRALTRHLRDKGVMRAAVSTVETDPRALLDRVREQPTMAGADLVTQVGTKAPYEVLGRHQGPVRGPAACGEEAPLPRGRRRPRHDVDDVSAPCRTRLQGHRAACCGHRKGDPGAPARRGLLQQWPG